MIAVVGETAAINVQKGDLLIVGGAVGMVKLNYHSILNEIELHLDVRRIEWSQLAQREPVVKSEEVKIVVGLDFRFVLLKELHAWRDSPAPPPPIDGE